ncbi:hypothetical protein [Prosthecomicrobium sp. N25]|uniref:hypothetical protein n=1 Tax=Prosthecomicrobium sp. N25 TaxID=3129254 RepID=UPI0030785515
METGTLRPIAAAPIAPARAVETAPTVHTELPVQAVVQQSGGASAAADNDGRAEARARRSNTIDLASVRRREIENDAATGMTVMKVIEEGSGTVLDQIPAESYLRMKVALQSVLDGEDGREHEVARSA